MPASIFLQYLHRLFHQPSSVFHRTTGLLILLAGMFLVPSTATPASGETVEELWKILNSKKNRTTPSRQSRREVAVHKLARKDSVESAKKLARVLADPFHHIRQEAVLWMIQEFKNEKPIAWLARRATRARNPVIRKNVVRTLAGIGSPVAASELARLASDPDSGVRLEVARAFGSFRFKSVPDALNKLTLSQNAAIAAAAFRSLGELGLSSASRLIRERISTVSGVPKAEACRALAVLEKEKSISLLNTYLDDPDPAVRMMALRGISIAESGSGDFLKKDKTLDAAVRALGDTSWRVQATAIDVLVNVWEPRVIPALIKNFKGVEGRLIIDYLKALQVMTGKKIGPDPLAWKGWWEAHASSFKLPEKPDNWKRGLQKSSIKHETTTFFNIPLYSRRIVFILDFSGGMANEAGGKNDRGLSKLDLAKQELMRSIRKLKNDHRINVLVYRYYSAFPPKTEIQTPFGNRLVPAERRAKIAVHNWLKNQEALGWGAFYEAFAAAARIREADTVIFLSDGVPTRGKHACITATGRKHFFRALAHENRYSQLMIHTVLTGKKGTDEKFMRKIAHTTGGYFDRR